MIFLLQGQGITVARTQDQALEILKGKPFWIWDEKEHNENSRDKRELLL